MGDKAEKKEKVAKPKKKAGFLGWLLLCLPIMLALGLFYTPLFMAAVLMAPAWLAMLMDQSDERAMAVCVGAGTLGGVMFYLANFLLAPPLFESALAFVRGPQAWLLPLGGAGVGATLYYIMPIMVIETVYLRNQAQKKSLEEMQNKLVEDWGDDIRHPG